MKNAKLFVLGLAVLPLMIACASSSTYVAGEDYNGVETVVDLEGLGRQLTHLGAVHGERYCLHVHQFGKELPPAFVSSHSYRVTDGIAQNGNF